MSHTHQNQMTLEFLYQLIGIVVLPRFHIVRSKSDFPTTLATYPPWPFLFFIMESSLSTGHPSTMKSKTQGSLEPLPKAWDLCLFLQVTWPPPLQHDQTEEDLSGLVRKGDRCGWAGLMTYYSWLLPPSSLTSVIFLFTTFLHLSVN